MYIHSLTHTKKNNLSDQTIYIIYVFGVAKSEFEFRFALLAKFEGENYLLKKLPLKKTLGTEAKQIRIQQSQNIWCMVWSVEPIFFVCLCYF